MKDTKEIKSSITENLLRFFGRSVSDATPLQIYNAVAMSVRDTVMENYRNTNSNILNGQKKTVWYLSLEFLTGKFLATNLLALGLYDSYAKALEELGLNISDVEDTEAEPGLGNGGLGRLAACFADSMACAALPAISCGIRYDFGLFRQRFVDGKQVELPDDWLADGCAWEIPVPEDRVEVLFYGSVSSYTDENGWLCYRQENCTRIVATPYDIPVCGYGNNWCNTLRLWNASSPNPVNLGAISSGDYVHAVAERDLAETISRVLYPNDSHNQGKSLRLSQQYFFTSATLQYMLKRHKAQGLSVRDLPDYAAVQINDTHPAIAIAELMRLLVDVEHIGWDEAWEICGKVFAYTNHTIMWEALESWPCYLMENLLPRIYMIIAEIDRRCRAELARSGVNPERLAVLREGSVHMANLCLSCCHKLNGVSELHTDILKNDLFADYHRLHPDRTIAVTNGVTPRRWILQSNPGLSALLTELLGGDGWVTDLSLVSGLEKYASDSAVLSRLGQIKRGNKLRFSSMLEKASGISVDPDSVVDVQVKRLHEYKRQLMNILRILAMYFELVEGGKEPPRPVTFVFGAKASPGYDRAKQIIELINSAAKLINGDKRTRGLLRVIFVENYCATSAGFIIPAADVSEQISLAGKEASGTGNMKFMMNGALTLGTLDGANVEMHRLLGNENIYIFGLRAEEVSNPRFKRPTAAELCIEDPWLDRAVKALGDGTLGSFTGLMNYLMFEDPYLCMTDFASYRATTARVLSDYENRDAWQSRSLVNIARSGFFSSDRSIAEYREKIWNA